MKQAQDTTTNTPASPTRRALIADDEPLARALIREFLVAHPQVQVVAEAGNGLDAARAIQDLRPDLVFLDIQMPKLTGLDVLQLTGLRQGVIFTTAHDQHALAAFDLHAVDYLLKPFTQARFDAALQKATQLASPVASPVSGPTGGPTGGSNAAGLDRLVAHQRLQRVLIRDGNDLHVLPLDEVAYAESQADYVAFHHAGREHLKPQRIADLEAQLDPKQFVRVHRSFIVNLRFLQALERTESGGHALRLTTGKRIPVSRSGHERLLAVL